MPFNFAIKILKKKTREKWEVATPCGHEMNFARRVSKGAYDVSQWWSVMWFLDCRTRACGWIRRASGGGGGDDDQVVGVLATECVWMCGNYVGGKVRKKLVRDENDDNKDITNK